MDRGCAITTQSRHTEPNANSAMALILRSMLPRNTVHYENTGMIVGSASLQPDIVVTGSDRAPVVIEAEFEPASNVEGEASARLGLQETAGNKNIESVIALRYPNTLRTDLDLDTALRSAELSYAILYLGGNRFPQSGWLQGSCEDIAEAVRLTSVPQNAVNEAVKLLELGIDTAAKRLDEISELRPRIADSIARLLGLTNVVQTRRMACAIVANAMVFHDRVAGLHDEVKPLHLVCGEDVSNPQAELSSAWNEILKINYWPIFAVARDIINQMHPADCRRVLHVLQQTAHKVSATGVGVSHDLTGRIFQSLIADRKYLATFYTLPASAALLARLAVDKMQGVDWSDAESLGKLRVADFACGTGALLAAVYDQIAKRHENEAGDSENLHKAMVEEVLRGFDVMPSAIHISGATLSGMHPKVKFGGSRLYNMPFGRQRDRTVAIGSLEFLNTSSVMSQINTNDPALRTGSAGEETAMNVIADAPDKSFDLVIMNPPFTRATNHEGAHADVTNPAFAAFGATKADQREMGKKINALGRGTSYDGNAGISSAFAALAHKKLKDGGVLALVLPLSMAAGTSWRKFRRLLNTHYVDLDVCSIANTGSQMSFSSDTEMGDCLIVGVKSEVTIRDTDSIYFASLKNRPADFATSAALAAALTNRPPIRRLNDGPYGGSAIRCGETTLGERLMVEEIEQGSAWGTVRIGDYSLSQTAYSLSRNRLELPGSGRSMQLPTISLDRVAKLGLVHRDINGPRPRGPFDLGPRREGATYSALWNHDAEREKRIICLADAELIPRIGMESHADKVWSEASKVHLNQEFTFGSQALSVAFTPTKTIGGSAWPNVLLEKDTYEKAYCLWSNSTLGLLMYWWLSNKQQSAKVRMTRTSARAIVTLDYRRLTPAQLLKADAIFEEFKSKELMPAYLADADKNRAKLDRAVICDLLRFDEDTLRAVRRLTRKWCAEPSVHGGKARPKSAFVRV